MKKDFKLETILTITTGINLVDSFNDVFQLVFYIFDDQYINTSALLYLKNQIKEHILKIHPELEKINYVPVSLFARENWLLMLKREYGEYLPISKIGKELNSISKTKTR